MNRQSRQNFGIMSGGCLFVKVAKNFPKIERKLIIRSQRQTGQIIGTSTKGISPENPTNLGTYRDSTTLLCCHSMILSGQKEVERWSQMRVTLFLLAVSITSINFSREDHLEVHTTPICDCDRSPDPSGDNGSPLHFLPFY